MGLVPSYVRLGLWRGALPMALGGASIFGLKGVNVAISPPTRATTLGGR